MKFILAAAASNGDYFNVERIHRFYVVEAFADNWHLNVTFVDGSAATLLTEFATEDAARDVMREIIESIGIIDPTSFQ